jgi:hypothetical protein
MLSRQFPPSSPSLLPTPTTACRRVASPSDLREAEAEAATRRTPYMELPFLTRRSADVLICLPLGSRQCPLFPSLSVSVCGLSPPPRAVSFAKPNAHGSAHPRAHKVGRSSRSHHDGMSRAVGLKEGRARFIGCTPVCASTSSLPRLHTLARLFLLSPAAALGFRE